MEFCIFFLLFIWFHLCYFCGRRRRNKGIEKHSSKQVWHTHTHHLQKLQNSKIHPGNLIWILIIFLNWKNLHFYFLEEMKLTTKFFWKKNACREIFRKFFFCNLYFTSCPHHQWLEICFSFFIYSVCLLFHITWMWMLMIVIHNRSDVIRETKNHTTNKRMKERTKHLWSMISSFIFLLIIIIIIIVN